VEFAKAHWDNAWRAYQFLKSTYGPDGFPRNEGVGHGWIEGGPLLPVRSELYQSGVGAEAIRALGSLAAIVGKADASQQLQAEFTAQKAKVNDAFWSPTTNFFGYAVDTAGKRIDTPSVLTTVPMWFGVLDPKKSDATIDMLAGADHQADWGMRIISQKDRNYEPSGYHYGSVWPLFTGWASVGEYRYHRPLPAYQNLRANALLALDGSAGHVTEVLSGDYYQTLATGSPHQIWSAAMVISPLLRGMMGLQVDALKSELTFAPHLPADWDRTSLHNVAVGATRLDLSLQRTASTWDLTITNAGASPVSVKFSPAASLRTRFTAASVNGTRVAMDSSAQGSDQHAAISVSAAPGKTTVHLEMTHDFAVGESASLPALGSTSEGVRITSESWSADRNTLTLTASGLGGRGYDLPLRNAGEIVSVEGAEVVHQHVGDFARVTFPVGSDYQSARIVFHFGNFAKPRKP
jgi:hypothetical protein